MRAAMDCALCVTASIRTRGVHRDQHEPAPEPGLFVQAIPEALEPFQRSFRLSRIQQPASLEELPQGLPLDPAQDQQQDGQADNHQRVKVSRRENGDDTGKDDDQRQHGNKPGVGYPRNANSSPVPFPQPVERTANRAVCSSANLLRVL